LQVISYQDLTVPSQCCARRVSSHNGANFSGDTPDREARTLLFRQRLALRLCGSMLNVTGNLAATAEPWKKRDLTAAKNFTDCEEFTEPFN
jgi:hypothetical protein